MADYIVNHDSQHTEIFTTPGTYTWFCPDDITSVTVECWGGGGAGASGVSQNNYGGGGGGGGGYGKKTISVTPETNYTVVVGGSGQDSYFISPTIVKGGAGANGNGTSGGSGGSYIGDIGYNGGNGGNVYNSGSAGGGYGGQGGTSANSYYAGGGGGGGAGNGISGNSGGGGGGGGGYSSNLQGGTGGGTYLGYGGITGNSSTGNGVGGSGGGYGGGGGGGGYLNGNVYPGGSGAPGAVYITYSTIIEKKDAISLYSNLRLQEYETKSNLSLTTELEPNKWTRETSHIQTWVKELTHDNLYIE